MPNQSNSNHLNDQSVMVKTESPKVGKTERREVKKAGSLEVVAREVWRARSIKYYWLALLNHHLNLFRIIRCNPTLISVW